MRKLKATGTSGVTPGSDQRCLLVFSRGEAVPAGWAAVLVLLLAQVGAGAALCRAPVLPCSAPPAQGRAGVGAHREQDG